MQEEVFDLKNAVIQKEKKVQEIVNQLSAVNLKNSKISEVTAQNEITQFYLKIAGVVCVL
ncbi:MAG: hypothetical protein ACRC5M_05505 [Anaeroplasmataceae bacterium]